MYAFSRKALMKSSLSPAAHARAMNHPDSARNGVMFTDAILQNAAMNSVKATVVVAMSAGRVGSSRVLAFINMALSAVLDKGEDLTLSLDGLFPERKVLVPNIAGEHGCCDPYCVRDGFGAMVDAERR